MRVRKNESNFFKDEDLRKQRKFDAICKNELSFAEIFEHSKSSKSKNNKNLKIKNYMSQNVDRLNFKKLDLVAQRVALQMENEKLSNFKNCPKRCSIEMLVPEFDQRNQHQFQTRDYLIIKPNPVPVVDINDQYLVPTDNQIWPCKLVEDAEKLTSYEIINQKNVLEELAASKRKNDIVNNSKKLKSVKKNLNNNTNHCNLQKKMLAPTNFENTNLTNRCPQNMFLKLTVASHLKNNINKIQRENEMLLRITSAKTKVAIYNVGESSNDALSRSFFVRDPNDRPFSSKLVQKMVVTSGYEHDSDKLRATSAPPTSFYDAGLPWLDTTSIISDFKEEKLKNDTSEVEEVKARVTSAPNRIENYRIDIPIVHGLSWIPSTRCSSAKSVRDLEQRQIMMLLPENSIKKESAPPSRVSSARYNRPLGTTAIPTSLIEALSKKQVPVADVPETIKNLIPEKNIDELDQTQKEFPVLTKKDDIVLKKLPKDVKKILKKESLKEIKTEPAKETTETKSASVKPKPSSATPARRLSLKPDQFDKIDSEVLLMLKEIVYLSVEIINRSISQIQRVHRCVLRFQFYKDSIRMIQRTIFVKMRQLKKSLRSTVHIKKKLPMIDEVAVIKENGEYKLESTFYVSFRNREEAYYFQLNPVLNRMRNFIRITENCNIHFDVKKNFFSSEEDLDQVSFGSVKEWNFFEKQKNYFRKLKSEFNPSIFELSRSCIKMFYSIPNDFLNVKKENSDIKPLDNKRKGSILNQDIATFHRRESTFKDLNNSYNEDGSKGLVFSKDALEKKQKDSRQLNLNPQDVKTAEKVKKDSRQLNLNPQDVKTAEKVKNLINLFITEGYKMEFLVAAIEAYLRLKNN
ncbi:hypothetical protein HK099_002674 [Clydaea vesicula]|uniref:Uncharacterized protein n=1 Tax=Clydaea vesicula TaxID=447962 RepID=A0AAD5U2R8_9FUNG|nr:hypothetical protein HK099_002674 [Clydaea vesicula]